MNPEAIDRYLTRAATRRGIVATAGGMAGTALVSAHVAAQTDATPSADNSRVPGDAKAAGAFRLATYNIWASDTLLAERLHAAGEELARLDADVVALQEVRSQVEEGEAGDAVSFIQELTGYPHAVMLPYPSDPSEGLAFLSKHPLDLVEAGWDTGLQSLTDCGLRVHIDTGAARLAVTNVHLTYGSVALREAQIVDVSDWIATRSEPGRYEFLVGDFNNYPESSIYRFMAGQQTLYGKGISYWQDLALLHATRLGSQPAATLDFWRNPRWKDDPTLEIPARFDWILIQDSYVVDLPYPSVTDAGIFGVDPTPAAQVVPSDHYGVFADLVFPEPE